jgi:hypothetical protein
MTRSTKTSEARSTPQSGGQTPKASADQFVTATLIKALWVQQSSGSRSTVRYADDRYDTSGAPR